MSTSDLKAELQKAVGDNYIIERELGGGGMSRVFVAREVTLGRDVVIKVLPPELGAGINIERFRREIQLAARLQHPHIVPLLSAGAKGDLLYYTMPLIEGETLRARFARSGELPLGESLRILRDVADALEYAHSHGVVHRDIKPENILVSGHHALVTDFGVAKALSAATGQATLTSVGVALGTPLYMSPEQAGADESADQRSDIYALGVVGYEIISGEPPFHGRSAQQLIAAHMTEKPVAPAHYRPSIPPELNDVIVRCIEKLPADRFQSAEELREELEMIAHTTGATTAHRVSAPTAHRDSKTRRFAILGAVVLVLLIGSLIAGRYLHRGAGFEIVATTQVTNTPGVEITPALSPDSKTLAYAAGEPENLSIFVKQVSGGDAIRLASGLAPQWSPDGTRLVYVAPDGISLVPAFGGTPRQLVANPQDHMSVSPVWSHDGKYLAYAQVVVNGSRGSVWVAEADGSNAHKVLDATEPHSLSWSPHDDRLALVEGNIPFVYSGVSFGNVAPSAVWVMNKDGSGATAVTDSIHHSVSPIWSGDGDGIFFVSNIRGGNDVYYQHLRGNHADGDPQRLTSGLKIHGIAGGEGDRIAYVAWNALVGIWSVPFPRSQSVSVSTARQVNAANETIEIVRLSPDAQWLAFDSDRSGNSDIYKMRTDGTQLQQLTHNTADDFRPSWSPDGRQIGFQSWRSGNRDFYMMASDGSHERVFQSGPAHDYGGYWSPDGSQVAFESDRSGPINIYLVSADGGNLRRLTDEQGGNTPRWSPDGKFVAYTVGVSTALGVPQNVLRIIPSDGGKAKTIALPAELGRLVAGYGWSADGKRLYVRSTAPDGTPLIASVGTDGNGGRVLVRFDDKSRPPFRASFATDEKTIYFTLGRHEADIWVMDLGKR